MLGRFVTDHLDLLHDHAALPLDLGTVQKGVAVHVGEDLCHASEVIRGSGRIVTGPLLGSVGIQVTPHPLDLLTDPAGSPLLGSLEEQVLEKVGDPADPCGLMPPSHRAPDPDRHGLRGGHRAGGDPEAVGKSGNPWLHQGGFYESDCIRDHQSQELIRNSGKQEIRVD